MANRGGSVGCAGRYVAMREAQPTVLIGARSEARGRALERAIGDDGRLALLGVHTRRDSLINALLASASASLIIDACLQDAVALDVLYRVQMNRPCHAVALCAGPSGEFVVEAVRAGAFDVMSWEEGTEQSRALVDAVIAAAASNPELVQIGASRNRVRRRRLSAQRQGPARVLALVGSRRAALLCDACDHLSAAFPCTIIIRQALHQSVMPLFAAQLATQTSMIVQQSPGSLLGDAQLALLDDCAELQLSHTGSGPRLRWERGSAARPGTEWMRSLTNACREEQLQLVVLTTNHVSGEELELLSSVVDAGGALARSTPDGYQLRWPDTQRPLRFGVAAFWDHLSQHIANMGNDANEEEG
ncbi:MAG: hypothetical protein RBU37_04490 [Myxococcota bacterium]|nr:hypothetical protein [Myxococcota bacterium]